jgi:hypothetical protein
MLFAVLAFGRLSFIVDVAKDASFDHGGSQVVGYSSDLRMVLR